MTSEDVQIVKKEKSVDKKLVVQSFLKSDASVEKLSKELDLILNKIEDLDYTHPGLEIIYDTIFKLLYFSLEMKQIVYGKDYFNRRYIGTPPWEIDEARLPIKKLMKSGWIKLNGKVLDIGCGTGNNVTYLAKKGVDVTGIDFSEMAIMKAREKAKSLGIEVDFFVRDLFNLPENFEKYDYIIDCGLYHGLNKDSKEKYPKIIEDLLNPKGTLFLMCTNEYFGFGPHRVPKDEITKKFENGFNINSIKKVRLRGAVGPMKFWLFSITKL